MTDKTPRTDGGWQLSIDEIQRDLQELASALGPEHDGYALLDHVIERLVCQDAELAALKNPAPQPSAPANESPEQSSRDSGVKGAAPIRGWLLTTPDGKDLRLSSEKGWNVELVIGEEQNAAGQTQVNAGECGNAEIPLNGNAPAQATGESQQARYKSAPAAPDMPEEPTRLGEQYRNLSVAGSLVFKWQYYADALRAALVAARADAAHKKAALVDAMDRLKQIPLAIQRADEAERRERGAQAKIDALMLEYCPDEMTQEQIENWGKHQKIASDAETALNAAPQVPQVERVGTSNGTSGSPTDKPAGAAPELPEPAPRFKMLSPLQSGVEEVVRAEYYDELRAVALAQTERAERLQGERNAAVNALELAVRQNSHDMLMTGDEIRQCEAIIAKSKERT